MKAIRPNKVKRAVKGILGAVRKPVTLRDIHKKLLFLEAYVMCDKAESLLDTIELRRIKGVNNDLVAYIANLERSQGVFSDTVWNPETQSWRKVA